MNIESVNQYQFSIRFTKSGSLKNNEMSESKPDKCTTNDEVRSISVYSQELSKGIRCGDENKIKKFALQLLYLYLKKEYGKKRAIDMINNVFESCKNIEGHQFQTACTEFSEYDSAFVSNLASDIGFRSYASVPSHFKDFANQLYDVKVDDNSGGDVSKETWDTKLYHCTSHLMSMFHKQYPQLSPDQNTVQAFNQFVKTQVFSSGIIAHKQLCAIQQPEIDFCGWPQCNLGADDNLVTKLLGSPAVTQLKKAVTKDGMFIELTKDGKKIYYVLKQCPYNNTDVFLHDELVASETTITNQASKQFRKKYFPHAYSVKKMQIKTNSQIGVYFVTYKKDGEDLKYYYVFKKPSFFRSRFSAIFNVLKFLGASDEEKKLNSRELATITIVKDNADKTDIELQDNIRLYRNASAKIVIASQMIPVDQLAADNMSQINRTDPTIFIGYSTNYNSPGEEHIAINNNIFPVNIKEEDRSKIIQSLTDLKKNGKLSYNPSKKLPLQKETKSLFCHCRFENDFNQARKNKVWWGTMEILDSNKSWYRLHDDNNNGDFSLTKLDNQQLNILFLKFLQAQLKLAKSGYVYADCDHKNAFLEYQNKIKSIKFIDVESLCTTEAMKTVLNNKLRTGNTKIFFEQNEVTYWSKDANTQNQLKTKFQSATEILHSVICNKNSLGQIDKFINGIDTLIKKIETIMDGDKLESKDEVLQYLEIVSKDLAQDNKK